MRFGDVEQGEGSPASLCVIPSQRDSLSVIVKSYKQLRWMLRGLKDIYDLAVHDCQLNITILLGNVFRHPILGRVMGPHTHGRWICNANSKQTLNRDMTQ
jgi:hypothetical protein